MAGYTKLHASILDSSVWLTDKETRLVWITMLAMADQDGVVNASVGGLAHRARVTHEECQAALDVFMKPDPDSRDGTTGERIEKVPGGWLVLNHANYRDIRTREQIATAARVKRYRESRVTVTGNDVTRSNAPPAYASESSSGGESTRGGKRTVPAEKPDDVTDEVWQEWLDMRRRQKSSTSALVLTQTRKKAEAAGMTMDEALTHWVAQGYKGFFPPDKGKFAKPAEPPRNFLPDAFKPAIVMHDGDDPDCQCETCCRNRRNVSLGLVNNLSKRVNA